MPNFEYLFAPAPVQNWNARFPEVQITFVSNNEQEDRFSAGINVCHHKQTHAALSDAETCSPFVVLCCQK